MGSVALLTFSARAALKGYVDVVFASAGHGGRSPLGTVTEEHFDTIFSLNSRGTLFTVQKALPMMRDGGSIILNDR